MPKRRGRKPLEDDAAVKELRELRELFPKRRLRTLALRVARTLPGKATQASKARRLVDKLKAEDRAAETLAAAQRASTTPAIDHLPPAIAALVAADERMQAQAQQWLDHLARGDAAAEALLRQHREVDESMQQLFAKYKDLFNLA